MVFGYFLYFSVICSITALYISVIKPVRDTYKPNDIIPFPLNEEVINNVESAMTHTISADYFYNFLYIDLRDINSLSIYALYSDLRMFNIMCDSKSCSYGEIRVLTNQIFKDYILVGAEFEIPENEIIVELRDKFDTQINSVTVECNEQLFESLFLFSVGGLKTYYDLFQHSDKFKDLKLEVER